MIDFEIEPSVAKRVKMFHMVAEQRDASDLARVRREGACGAGAIFPDHVGRQCDGRIRRWSSRRKKIKKDGDGAKAEGNASRMRNLYTVITTEELCWGDAGLFLSTPNAGLGGAAVMAAGTPEQKERFL